jgi:hypothetical protein
VSELKVEADRAEVGLDAVKLSWVGRRLAPERYR